MDRVGDRIEIQELIYRYAHLVDDRDWDRLREVFTEDASFDASEAGYPPMRGPDEVAARWRQVRHPAGHHSTNVLIEFEDDDAAIARSKGISIFAEDGRGPSSSVDYEDRVVRSADGWRIASRRATRRRMDPA
jgi:ketosteroid isomerase-like protein